jgi:hypothetical protein
VVPGVDMWTKTMAAVKVLTAFKKKHRNKLEQVVL